MNARLRLHVLGIALVSMLAVFACSDDENPADGGTTDTTPPGVSSIVAIDANHVEVGFGENVTRGSAEDTDNYTITPGTPHPVSKPGTAGGSTVNVIAASLKSDNRTVTLSTSTMSATDYTLAIQGVSDVNGNVIDAQIQEGFQGSSAADNTPPVITYRSPAPNATGVALSAPIAITFSEPVQFSSFNAGVSMTDGTNIIPVNYTSDDLTHFTGTHNGLENNTLYEITLISILDNSGNAMTDTEWSFRTTNATDNTPPTLVSSIPAHNALNVDVNSNLSLTFSEAIDQADFSPLLTPDVIGEPTWSNGGKTVTFDPLDPLADDTQYTLIILPGDAEDLAGNPNANLITVVFTTGNALETGSISGTIAGDPNSDAAGDPTGALVAALTGFLLAGDDYVVTSVTTVAGNNTYNLTRLPDDTYYPLCILDSNGDDETDPLMGDATGFYGINLAIGDVVYDSVTVAGGNSHPGTNFPLHDPTAVTGAIYYKGMYAAENHVIFVGLFDPVGFNPNTSVPVAGTEATWPDFPFYLINSIEAGEILDGTFYVGAFLDANDSGDFEPAIDPAGLYGGGTPIGIDLTDGNDAFDVNFFLLDPAPPMPGASAASTRWPTAPHVPWLRNLSEKVRQASLAQQK